MMSSSTNCAEVPLSIRRRRPLTGPDLRDPAVIPLNFTKSINLAISERGVNALRRANRPAMLDAILQETIPMYGRMIHGERRGQLYQQHQAYDIDGKARNWDPIRCPG